MTLKQTEIKSLIEKSRNFGFSEIPKNVSSEIVEQMIQVCKANPEKFWSAKEFDRLLEGKSRKYFSDTLWGLAEKKILRKAGRGIYQFNPSKENPEL